MKMLDNTKAMMEPKSKPDRTLSCNRPAPFVGDGETAAVRDGATVGGVVRTTDDVDVSTVVVVEIFDL
jgi:hypothetical protein